MSELDDDRLSHVRAGWIDVANTSQQVMPSQTIARIDPYPYQHRIFEIMQTKPLILPADYTLLEAAKQMKNDKLDCVFVGTKPEDVIGIVSERDIVHAMALPFSEVEKARDMQLGAIMSSPVITVRDKDFMHVGLGRIGHHDLRHLGVVNSDGALVGWLSLRELTRQRMTNVIVIGDKLSTASSEKEMKEALQELPYLAMSLLSDGVPAHVIAAVISHEYRSALRRAAVLAQDRLIKQGRPVPCDYVLLILGSAGRAESLLAADQDHAIIYEDTPTDPAIEKNWQDWFETLGGYISDILDAAGIPYCTGKVMSSNPQWCRSLSGWQKTITEWIRNERPQDLLNVDIFFDYEPVYGA